MCTEITDSFDASPPNGWVLYDASCSLCMDLLTRVRPTLQAGGFQPAPLQSPWVRGRLNLPKETLLAQMRVLTPEGKALGGADALVYLARELDWHLRPWWAWLLMIFGKMPFALPLLRSAYRGIAARRHCRQGTCSVAETQILKKEGRQ